MARLTRKERMKAEYEDLSVKCDKLESKINSCKGGYGNAKLSCPVELLEEQLEGMRKYQYALAARCYIEGVL